MVEEPIITIEYCRECGLELSECMDCGNIFCSDCEDSENLCPDCIECYYG
jgi:hypothetical protein